MAEFEFNLRDVFRIVRRRKAIIVLSPLAAGLLTYFISQAPPPVYEAESVIKVSRVAASMQALLVETLSWYQGDNIATQSQIITSRKIKTRVAWRLGKKHASYQPVTSLVDEGEALRYQLLEERVRAYPELVALIDGLKISADRKGNSDAVGIISQAPTGELAIDVANYAAEEFSDYNVAERNSQIRDAVRFIQGRIKATNDELARGEQKLENFKREYRNTLGLDLAETGSVAAQLDGIGRQIAELEEGIARLQSLSQMEEYLSSSPALSDSVDPLIGPLEQQLLQLIIESNQARTEGRVLLSYLTDESREVQDNLLKIEELEQNGRHIVESLIHRYQVVLRDLRERQIALISVQERMEEIPEASRQLSALEREVELKRESLNLFQRRLQDAEIQEASEIKEVTLVEQASNFTVLAQQSRMLKGLAGLLIGLMLGGVFAVVLESMDTSIGTIEDVERYVGLPVLGVIPHLNREMVRQNILVEEMAEDVSAQEINFMASLCTHFAPSEPVSESFRSMRAQLEVVLKKNGWQTLMMTSSVLQEGKTSTASNLAVVFGQAGHRTLLIDADLRRPSVHKIFGLPQSPGLSEVLLGINDLDGATQSMDDLILGKMGLKNSHITPGLEYVFVLTAGRRVERPAELLNLERFSRILEDLQHRYDIIMVDIAPVLPVAEATQLSPGVDATLLAYQIGRVGREVVNRTRGRLQNVGGNVIGLIMNDIEAEILHTQDYEYDYKYRYEETVAREGILERLKKRFSRPEKLGSTTIIDSAYRSGPQKPIPRDPSSSPPRGSDEITDIMKLTDDKE